MLPLSAEYMIRMGGEGINAGEGTMEATETKTHEVTGIEYHSKSGCSTISASVEYQMIQDGDELVPEIQRLFFDEWVDETRALRYEVRMAFYDDWKKGLVQL